MAKSDLLVIEGDIVIHNKVLEGFEECPNTYCVHVFWVGASYKYGLGCTRFRAGLIANHPDLVRVAAHRTNDGVPIVGFWGRMDTRICDEARDRGLLGLNTAGKPSPSYS